MLLRVNFHIESVHCVILQIALSIGGWTMSSEFGRCTRDSTKRAKLVNSLEYFIDRWALDIVDIDWEYPSKAGCGGGHEDFCKMVISRGSKFKPDLKDENSSCDHGAVYKLYDQLKNGFPIVIQHVEKWDTLGQTVSTAEECSAYHEPNWTGVPSGAAGMAAYWAKSIFNDDWVNYIQLLTDFANKSYGGKKLAVTSAVGMDTCMSTGKLNGKQCQESPGFRTFPPDPKGQGRSLKQFCDVQSNTGGFVNLMTYDFFGNWAAPYHNAPLYDNPNQRVHEDYLYEYNVDLSCRNWLTKSDGGVHPDNEGCRLNQLNVGLALYGRSFSKAGAFGKFGPKLSTQVRGVGSYQAGVISLWDLRHRFLTAAQGGDCDSSGWGNTHCGSKHLLSSCQSAADLVSRQSLGPSATSHRIEKLGPHFAAYSFFRVDFEARRVRGLCPLAGAEEQRRNV